jgi:4-hydroxythreonine-4-phosphate dehydrogenase
MQNSELANQVTAEHNINTYGPYTIDQIMAEDTAWHFDAVITTSSSSTQHITEILSQEIPVRYFASKKAVVTAAYQSVQIDTEGKTTNISWLTHPIYAAIDVIRNRAFYDKARRNPLQKLFRDKRDDRKKEDTTQENANNDKTERAS